MRGKQGFSKLIALMVLIVIVIVLIIFFFPDDFGNDEETVSGGLGLVELENATQPVEDTPLPPEFEQNTSDTNTTNSSSLPGPETILSYVGSANTTTPLLGSMRGPEDIAIVGNYLYVVSSESNSFSVIDVSDPTNPIGVGSVTAESDPDISSMIHPVSVFIKDALAYVASSQGNSLAIIDISDPALPNGISQITKKDDFILEDMISPSSVFVSGNFSYITGYNGASVSVIDVSDRFVPKAVVSINKNDDPNVTHMANPLDLFVIDPYVYVVGGLSSQSGLTIINFTHFTAPKGISSVLYQQYVSGFVLTRLLNPNSIHAVGDYVYVTSSDEPSLSIINATDILKPAGVSQLIIIEHPSLAALTAPSLVFTSGDYSYVASADGAIGVVNVTNLGELAGIGTVSSNDDSRLDLLVAPSALLVQDKYVYVVSKETDSLFILESLLV